MTEEAKKVVINGREYPFPEEYTMGELADVEEIVGQGYDFARGGVRSVLALLYIAAHRVDSTVTIADIRALQPEDFEVKGDLVHPLAVETDDSTNGSVELSSDSSEQTSEPSQENSDLNGTGTPVSGTGVTSASETSTV
jgi:hypothetical protein